MNVLYLINYAGNGGSERYVENLISEYNEKKCDCFFAYNEGGALAKKMAEKHIITFKIDMSGPFDFSAVRALAKICVQNKIDIIHTQYPRENVIACLTKRYCPGLSVIYTNHFLTPSPFAWRLINRVICRKNERVIAVCEASKRLLVQNGYSEKKIRVIYNGARKPSFSEKTLRRELSVDDDVFVISTLSRFSPEKRMDFIPDIASALKKMTDEKFLFVIAGDGEGAAAVKEKAEKLGVSDKIRIIGYREDTENVLQSGNAFVNCSETEALSFAITEALSFGLPCVVSDVGGNGEIINETTGGGVKCDKDSPEEFASAFLRLMTDKDFYERCVAEAKKSFEERFCLEAALEKTYSMYEEIYKKAKIKRK